MNQRLPPVISSKMVTHCLAHRCTKQLEKYLLCGISLMSLEMQFAKIALLNFQVEDLLVNISKEQNYLLTLR